MLAAAVVGRPIIINFLSEANAKSWTDGERIYLVINPSSQQMRSELLVQCVLLCGKSLEVKGLKFLIGSIEQRQRFLMLEVERCSIKFSDQLPTYFIQRVNKYSTSKSPKSAEESLAIARGLTRLASPPEWYGTIQPWRILRKNLRVSGGQLSKDQLSKMEGKIESLEENEPDEDDDSIARNKFWKILSSPLGKDGFLSKFLREIFDMKSSPDEDAADTGVEGSAEIVSGRVSNRLRDISKAVRSTVKLVMPKSISPVINTAHSYPEWDNKQQKYLQNWTKVEEVMPSSDEPKFDIERLNQSSNRALQRSLATLCLGFKRHRRQMQGDDLDLDSMVRLATDLQGGYSGDERIYSASLKTRRDLGVMILLDLSSSTLERIGNEEKVFDRQAQAAWQLCKTLETLGDRVALYGFHSWGRTLVRFQTIKTFDELISGETEARMHRLSIAGYTRCGAAIRHANVLLSEHSGTPFKMLLVISDGYPYDDEYEGDYAASDTRKAMEEANSKGIACLCLSVGSDADTEQLKHVYGSTNYIAIDEVNSLHLHLRKVIEDSINKVASNR